MKVEQKIAHHRMGVLELAEALGNVSEACRRRGMTRTQFYDYKRRFQTHGLEGLKDLPPVAKSHPNWIPEETKDKIVAVALEFPSYGCQKLEPIVQKRLGQYVSNVTIQKTLIDHGLGSRYQRWLAIEKKMETEAIKLTEAQIRFIEKSNPNFRERHVETSKPGELINQDTFLVGTFKGVGRVYLHAAIDPFCSFAFGFLHTNKKPEGAVAVLHNEVLPFYREKKLKVENILSDNGREFCGTDSHPFQLYLELNDIKHRTTRVRRPQTNGFIERFNRTVLDEFFRLKFRQKVYETVEELQKDLDKWLRHYNYERPHLGYRNHGRTPWESMELYLKGEGKTNNKTTKKKKSVK